MHLKQKNVCFSLLLGFRQALRVSKMQIEQREQIKFS